MTLVYRVGILHWVMSNDDVALSDFEQREQFNEEAGELPWWTEQGESGEGLFCIEGRVPDHPEWRFVAKFARERSDILLVDLRIRPAGRVSPAGGLHTSVIRSISLNALFRTARDWIELPRNVGLGIDLHVERDQFGRPRRPGRRGQSDLFYAQWAALYVDEVANGSAPVSRLAKIHDFSEATIRGFLNQARRRDLLTAAPAGGAGGSLTDKALTLLADQAKVGPTPNAPSTEDDRG